MSNNVVYLKLITGENILCTHKKSNDSNQKGYVTLLNPLEVHTINYDNGSHVRLSHWVPCVEKDEFTIHINAILLFESPIKELEQYYKNCLISLKQTEKESVEEVEDYDKGDVTIH